MIASTGDMISIVSPSVSCSARYFVDLADEDGVVGAGLVEPEDGRRLPIARARVTASLTQSRIAASFVWHMRQMSPDDDGVLEERRAGGVDDADRAGAGRPRTSCRASRTLRRPAPSGRRSAPSPSSPGRTRRGRGSRR